MKKILASGVVLTLLFSMMLFAVVAETEIRSVQEIYDWNDLDGVRQDLSGSYVLMNDLDSGTSGYSELVGTTQGWEPIGMDSFSPFTGTFDGNGFEIIDLFIDRPDTHSDWESVGLFGTVEEDAEITDIGIVDADINGNWYVATLVGNNRGTVRNSHATGDVNGESRVGGLIGANSGTLSNSHADSTVSGESQIGGLSGRNTGIVSSSHATGDVDGEENTGGLVGFNWDATVSDSYATGTVSGEDSEIGGLVGYNYGGSSVVTTSYAAGDVDGDSQVGGLVGRNDGTIFRSYASGAVSGDGSIGGLLGYNDGGEVENTYATGAVNGNSQVGGLVGWNTDEGTVRNSYSIGTVSGDSNVGGLVGYAFGWGSDGITYDSFWDTETSGMDTSDGGTDKTTAEMKDVATYTDTDTEGLENPWDFVGNPNDDQGDEEIWDIDPGINEGYPFLVEDEPEEYTLTITVVGQGSTDPGEGTHTYLEGEQVTITATPDTGWYFFEWQGDHTGTEDEITVMMDGDLDLTAVFEEETGFVPTDLELDVDPTSGDAPLEVTIYVSAENIGDLDGSIDVVVDGTVEHTLDIPAGESADHTFTHTFYEMGSYLIEFDELTEVVVVDDVTEFEPVNMNLDVHPLSGDAPLEVTIYVSAENIGTVDGFIDVLVDGAVGYMLNVPAGASADHTFTHTFNEEGTYLIEFYDLTETVEVSDTSEFIPVNLDLQVDPTSGETPLDVDIHVYIENAGDEQGSLDIIIDGVAEYTIWVTAQGSTSSTYTHTFFELGTFTIEFGHLSEIVSVEGDDLFLPSIEITSPDDGFIFNSHTETIRWSAEQGQYPISHFEIRFDDGNWMHTGTVDHHTFTELDEGHHIFHVKVVDSQGNEDTASVDFNIEIKEDDPSETELPVWASVSIIVLTVLLVVGLVTLIFLSRKGKEDNQQDGSYQEEEVYPQDEQQDGSYQEGDIPAEEDSKTE